MEEEIPPPHCKHCHGYAGEDPKIIRRLAYLMFTEMESRILEEKRRRRTAMICAADPHHGWTRYGLCFCKFDKFSDTDEEDDDTDEEEAGSN